MGFLGFARPSVPTRFRIAIASVPIACSLVLAAAPAAEPATAATNDDASRVIAIAESHLGAPWVYGATGPYAFDCSGLVYSVFRDAGLFSVIGDGSVRTASDMWSYFAARGQASPTDGQPGDLVIFGNGAHVGIYLGNGWVISTLITGVGYSTLWNTIPSFTTFLHTHLSGVTTASATTAGVLRYTTVWLNFRTGPALWYGINWVLAPATPVTVIGTARDGYDRVWDEVRLQSGAVGWVASWFLT